jgi:hypothetical protein
MSSSGFFDDDGDADNSAKWMPPPSEEYRRTKEKSGNGDDRGSAGGFPEPEWPAPLAMAAMPGIVGEFVAILMPHTEADPAALVFQFLTAFGNVIGLSAHYQVEGDLHPARLNIVLVGVTAKGRKGTSWSRVRALFGLIDPNWEQNRIASGLSTGEGLIFQVRDERIGRKNKGEEVCIDKGEPDKRFLALSTEFAGVLRMMARAGNSLSPVVRDAWDRSTLRTLTKSEPLTATGAHISQIGHCTADELRRYLDATEAANGFANRYLFVCVRRARLLPDGGGYIDWEPFAHRLNEIVTGALSISRVTMDEEAHVLWCRVYEKLSEPKPGLLGAVLARAEAQVIRLALTYALLDQSPYISTPHLRAALECWRYAEQSARFVFGDALGEPVADGILAALRQAPDGLTRTQISEVFDHHVTANKLAQGFQILQRAGLVTPEKRATDGRPAVVWHAVRKGYANAN